MSKRNRALAIAALATLGGAAVAVAAIAPIKEYAVGIDKGYVTKRIVSSGDTLPVTGDPSRQYQIVGIPDGLGAHRNADGTATVFMNHELAGGVVSTPYPGAPNNRGALVTELVVDRSGTAISARRAYDTVFDENTLVGPAAAADNTTRAFSRFCSGDLGGPEHGFDRYIYLTNEEEGTPANSFDGKGGVTVAITGNALYTLPKLGRFSWENSVIQKDTGRRTVIMGMEDGPTALDPAAENSQLYMYVGQKDRRPGQTVLGRNGLDNGTLYVAVPASGADVSEATFAAGSFRIAWVAIPDAGELTEGELEAASDAVGAIRFARPEDGAFNERNPDEFVFVTTGGAAGANTLGRLYSLKLDERDPTRPGTLKVLYNADTVVAGGGDIAVSPDNIGISDKYLMINEDGTAESRPVMGAKNRDGSIWRFDIDKKGVDVGSAVRVVELDPPGRSGSEIVGPGVWETSGIIDAKGLFRGGESWLFDVQAHPPTPAPAPGTVEDGQLLLLARR